MKNVICYLIGAVLVFIVALVIVGLLIIGVAHAAAPEASEATESDPYTVEVTVDDITAVADQIAGLDAELDMLAQLVYAEARGVDSKAEQSAVIWCVLNRVDDSRWANNIAGVVTASHQFAYRASAPVTDELRELARDVVTRWLLEKRGIADVGRVLPAEYCYFAGHGGHNWFRIAYRGGPYWDWSLPDPYQQDNE